MRLKILILATSRRLFLIILKVHPIAVRIKVVVY